MRARIALLCFAFVTVAASAESISVRADGQPVAGAEACWWKSGAAGNPVTRFFSASEIVCRSADADVPIPPGEWNLFARKGGELVSEESVLVTSGHRPKQFVLDVVPAMRPEELKLRDGERAFAYLPRTRSAIPFELVPAGATAIPVIVANGKPVRLGGPPPRDGFLDLIVPVQFASVPQGKVAAPAITANAVPAVLVPKAGATSLAIFRNVKSGAIAIALRGERWKAVEKNVTLPGPFAIADSIATKATSKLTVHWWARVDLTTLAHVERNPALKAALLRCPDQKPKLDFDIVNTSTCVAEFEKTLQLARDGTFELVDVPAGLYFLRFSVSGLPNVYQSIEVTADDTSHVEAELRYLSFFGRVTRGGKPVKAKLFDTVSDAETGEYTAVLRTPPGGPINVVADDGSWKYRMVAEHPPADNDRFDVDVPLNRIIVTVLDEPSGAPIGKARISLVALIPHMERAAHFAGPIGVTDTDGTKVIEPVLTNRELHVCASDDTHDSKCTDNFTIKDDEEKRYTLALPRVVKREGHVVTASGSMSDAQIVWWTPDGRRTEAVTVGNDGSFIYKQPHADGEIVTYLAADQPFYVFRQPHVDEGAPFVITLPAARRRTFTVSLAASTSEKGAFLALRIGDLYVPANALSWHADRHDVDPVLQPGWTVTIPDILETGPITVIEIPFSVFDRHPHAEMPFIPEAPALPQQALGERDAITFD